MKIKMKYWIRQLLLVSCILISLSNISLASADTIREAEILFNWAENNYPQYFPSHQPTQNTDSWLFRFYPETNIYTGVNTSDHGVYVLGGPWGSDNPTYIDNLPNFLQTIGNGKLTDVIAIVTNGSDFSTALKSDGSVWQWGSRAGPEAVTIPIQVGGLTDVTKIVSGEFATIALKNDGTVWAWGDNSRGDFGDGTKINRQTSVDLVPISGLTDVSAIGESGAFSPSYLSSGLYAITQDGKLWVWGCLANEILDGSTIYPPSCPDSPRLPVIIEGLTDVINFKSRRSSSTNNYYVLKRDGTVWAWGDNSYGQLGDGTTTARKTPTKAVELAGVIDLAIAQSFVEQLNVPLKISVFALRQDGTVWAWGNNIDNPLGVGATASYVSVPTLIASLTGIKKLAIGPYHKLALRNDGTVWAWGKNGGRLGDGTTIDRDTPVQVIGLTDVIDIKTTYHSSYAIKADGTVWAWGDNRDGQLGNGTNIQYLIPIQVVMTGIADIISNRSGSFTHALRNDSTVWSWGINTRGSLGTGTFTNSNIPLQVISP